MVGSFVGRFTQRVALFAGGVLATVLSTSAQAESPWYLSGSVGAYLRDDQDGATTFFSGGITGPGTQHETYDAGPTISAALGYKLPMNFRIEGEATYAHYTPDHINPSSPNFPALNGSSLTRQSGGDYNRYMATVNLFYDLPLQGRYVPYVGGGLGYAHSDQSTAVFTNGSNVTFRQAGSSTDHGVAIIEGGITIAVSAAWSVVPAYRYVHFFSDPNVFGDETAHIFKLGVRYSFQ